MWPLGRCRSFRHPSLVAGRASELPSRAPHSLGTPVGSACNRDLHCSVLRLLGSLSECSLDRVGVRTPVGSACNRDLHCSELTPIVEQIGIVFLATEVAAVTGIRTHDTARRLTPLDYCLRSTHFFRLAHRPFFAAIDASTLSSFPAYFPSVNSFCHRSSPTPTTLVYGHDK